VLFARGGTALLGALGYQVLLPRTNRTHTLPSPVQAGRTSPPQTLKSKPSLHLRQVLDSGGTCALKRACADRPAAAALALDGARGRYIASGAGQHSALHPARMVAPAHPATARAQTPACRAPHGPSRGRA